MNLSSSIHLGLSEGQGDGDYQNISKEKKKEIFIELLYK